MQNPDVDHYQVLGIKPRAKNDEIEAAYQRRVLQYDQNLDNATEEIQQCRRSYEVLSNQEKRTKAVGQNNFSNTITVLDKWMDGIVPFPMKFGGDNVENFQGVLFYFDAGGIGTLIQATLNGEPRCRCCCRDQLNDDLMREQWSAAPIFCNEREETMFNPIPFARSRRVVRNGNRQIRYVRQTLKFQFP